MLGRMTFVPKTPSEKKWNSPDEFPKQCHATSKQTRKRCRRVGVRLNNEKMWVCKNHGGNNFGPKNRTYKDLPGGDKVPTMKSGGRYSAALGPLAVAYKRVMDAGDMYDLTPGLALMDLHTEELLRRAITLKESPDWRGELLREAQMAGDILQGKEDGDFNKAFFELVRKIAEGVEADKAMSGAIDVVERRAVRTEKAIELKLKSDATINVAQVVILLHLIADILIREVPELAPRVMDLIDTSLREKAGLDFGGASPRVAEIAGARPKQYDEEGKPIVDPKSTAAPLRRSSPSIRAFWGDQELSTVKPGEASNGAEVVIEVDSETEGD